MLPFLKAGMVLAVSQTLGKMPKFSDWVNITCNTGATFSVQVLRNCVGISSGPATSPGLRFRSVQCHQCQMLCWAWNGCYFRNVFVF